MAIRLSKVQMGEVLDAAYLLATSDARLPELWVERAERLGESPSVGFIAAVGAALLAKATHPEVNSYVIQAKEGSAGAYSLRSAATVLARRRHSYGYDIGSTSDSDPINHGTLVSSLRWDVAFERITPPHKPFFQVILQWLGDIDTMDSADARQALAAFIRVRREVAGGAAVRGVPVAMEEPPRLADLVDVLEGFSSADSENGARGMALVVATFKAAGFEAEVSSPNDPRRIDVAIKRGGAIAIAAEVKQRPVSEGVAQTLMKDAAALSSDRALLAVLRPGTLDFDRSTAVRRAEREYGMVLRLTSNVRELLHEAVSATEVSVESFCSGLPRLYAEALRDIRVAEESIDTWAAIARRWA